jgi:hypothetical protein
MRILRLLHGSRAARVLFLVGTLGLSAGCGGEAPAHQGVPADAQEAQAAEREARQKAFGKTGMPPDTKRAALRAPKS